VSRAFYYFSRLSSRARVLTIYVGVAVFWWLLLKLSAFSAQYQLIGWFLPGALSYGLLLHFGSRVVLMVFLAAFASLLFEFQLLQGVDPFGLSPTMLESLLLAALTTLVAFLITSALRAMFKQKLDPAFPSHFFASFVGALLLAIASVGATTMMFAGLSELSSDALRQRFFSITLAHFTGTICLTPLLSHWIEQLKLHIWLDKPSYMQLAKKRYRPLDNRFWLLLAITAALILMLNLMLFSLDVQQLLIPLTGVVVVMLSAFLGLFYSQYALSLSMFTLSAVMIYSSRFGSDQLMLQLQQMLPVIAAAAFGYMFLPFLQQRNQMLLYLVNTDPLTGINNRYFLFKQGELELLRARRYQRPLALLMIDLDLFKSINDTYGHIAGDEVLEQFTIRCRNVLREDSVLCRYGGEEFVILLPEADMAAALMVYERIRRELLSTPFRYQHFEIKVTISVGVAELGRDDKQLQDLIKRADDKLYQAKREGRDAVRF